MSRIIAPLISVLAIAGIAVGNARPTVASAPADTLYGSVLVGPYVSVGRSIVTIDQNDAAITPFAPQGPFGFIAVAFDSGGKLFATGCAERGPAPGSGNFVCPHEPARLLMELDPLTSEVVEIIGPVTDVFGSEVNITVLSVQPETDVLFGLSVDFDSPPSSPRMWTIDKSTAAATLIASEVPAGCGDHCSRRNDAFAFAPDGTLYHIFRVQVPDGELSLMTLDPRTGAEISSVPIDSPFPWYWNSGGLAVRSDGGIFANFSFRFPDPCRTGCPPPPINALTTIDPLTGAMTEIGGNEWALVDLAFSPVVVVSIDLDIKPGSDPSVVNPLSRGVVPVAIFGSHDFDVADIDVTSLTFGFGDALPASVSRRDRDVDADGFPDLLLHFRTAKTGIEIGDTESCLSGKTLDGTPFSGCDTIRTVPNR